MLHSEVHPDLDRHGAPRSFSEWKRRSIIRGHRLLSDSLTAQGTCPGRCQARACVLLFEPPPRDEHLYHGHGAGQSFAQAEVATVVDSISWGGWEASRQHFVRCVLSPTGCSCDAAAQRLSEVVVPDVKALAAARPWQLDRTRVSVLS